LRCFFPTIILGIVLISIFQITIYDLKNRLTNLSVCLLTVIAIMKESRGAIPEIGEITFADKFTLPYIVMSILPLGYLVGSLFSIET
jgi:hypothetical protein